MIRRVACILPLLSLATVGAFAQSTYGTLVGTIKDATGAMVPNATVWSPRWISTPAKLQPPIALAITKFPNLLPGNYDVSVDARGFKKFVFLDGRGGRT